MVFDVFGCDYEATHLGKYGKIYENEWIDTIIQSPKLAVCDIVYTLNVWDDDV